MPFDNIQLCVKRKINLHFNYFILLLLSWLKFSLQGKSYSQEEKGVEKYDLSELTINTLVH